MTWLVLLLGLVITLLVSFFWTLARSSRDRAADPTEEMDADSRSLYGPIRRLAEEIETLAGSKDSVAARVVGKEAAEEASRIRQQVARALVARSELKRASRGASLVERDLEDLGQRAEAAQTEAERQALQLAHSAKSIEMSHYARAKSAIEEIDLGTRQAEAALSEMRTRLRIDAAPNSPGASDELRDTVGRLKSLSVSYDEAEQTLGSLNL